MPGESLCVGVAYTDGNGNRNATTEIYAHTTAASYTGASAVRLGLRRFVRELAKQFASSLKAASSRKNPRNPRQDC